MISSGNKILLTLFFLLLPILFLFKNENIKECQENGPKCNLNNGECISNICKCFPGYITYPEENQIKCNYKLRSNLIALLLEIISCNGYGFIYIRQYFIALIKFFGWLFMCFIYQKYAKFKENNSLVIIIISSIIFLECFYYKFLIFITFLRINILMEIILI